MPNFRCLLCAYGKRQCQNARRNTTYKCAPIDHDVHRAIIESPRHVHPLASQRGNALAGRCKRHDLDARTRRICLLPRVHHVEPVERLSILPLGSLAVRARAALRAPRVGIGSCSSLSFERCMHILQVTESPGCAQQHRLPFVVSLGEPVLKYNVATINVAERAQARQEAPGASFLTVGLAHCICSFAHR